MVCPYEKCLGKNGDYIFLQMKVSNYSGARVQRVNFEIRFSFGLWELYSSLSVYVLIFGYIYIYNISFEFWMALIQMDRVIPLNYRVFAVAFCMLLYVSVYVVLRYATEWTSTESSARVMNAICECHWVCVYNVHLAVCDCECAYICVCFACVYDYVCVHMCVCVCVCTCLCTHVCVCAGTHTCIEQKKKPMSLEFNLLWGVCAFQLKSKLYGSDETRVFISYMLLLCISITQRLEQF